MECHEGFDHMLTFLRTNYFGVPAFSVPKRKVSLTSRMNFTFFLRLWSSPATVTASHEKSIILTMNWVVEKKHLLVVYFLGGGGIYYPCSRDLYISFDHIISDQIKSYQFISYDDIIWYLYHIITYIYIEYIYLYHISPSFYLLLSGLNIGPLHGSSSLAAWLLGPGGLWNCGCFTWGA